MNNIAENINNVIKSCSETVSASEDDFIKLGSYLQKVYGTVSNLTVQTDTSAKLLQGKDGNILENIKGISNSILLKLDSSQKNINETVSSVTNMISFMNKFTDIQGNIDKAAKYLNAVALNIIIETARTSEIDENFTIIANEIKELSSKITEISGKIRKDSEIALLDFNSADSNIASALKEFEVLKVDSRDTISASITDTEGLLDRSFATIKSVNESTKSINSEVGKIIVAIQLHDNINQRIQHINQGFEDVLQLTETDDPLGEKNYNREERIGLASQIVDIQYSQLQEIVTDLDSIHINNSAAFEGIIEQITEFNNNLLLVEGDKSKGNMILNLSSSLNHLNDLRNQGNSVIENLHEISLKSSETAQRLSSHIDLVQTISDEAHIKALNAIIASDKLGYEGLTLKVLSQEMRNISDETDTFVSDVEEILKEITCSASILKKSSVNETAEDDLETTQLIDNEIRSITETYSEVKKNLIMAYQGGDDLKNSIKQSINELNFLKDMTESFKNSLDIIESLKGYFKEFDVDMNKTLLNDSYFSERYTMEKERIVHNQSINKAEEAANHTDPAQDRSEEDDDLGDFDMF
jgi:methyl-accepting chemotaxis protein